MRTKSSNTKHNALSLWWYTNSHFRPGGHFPPLLPFRLAAYFVCINWTDCFFHDNTFNNSSPTISKMQHLTIYLMICSYFTEMACTFFYDWFVVFINYYSKVHYLDIILKISFNSLSGTNVREFSLKEEWTIPDRKGFCQFECKGTYQDNWMIDWYRALKVY